MMWLLAAAKAIWRGGSGYDAWINSVSVQTGMGAGIVFMVLYGLTGCWCSYTMSCLYREYRRVKANQIVNFDNYTIQWWEVLDGLLGCRWKIAGLVFNNCLLFCTATIQIIACGSTVYYINDSLNTRSWTLIFGACCCSSILAPTHQHYRMWSFLGVIMITYAAWYLTIGSIVAPKDKDVMHTGPRSMEGYFLGLSNSLYAFGGHAVTVEIMDAMWKPRHFQRVYFYAVCYTFSLTLPSAIAVYYTFGDKLLSESNAFAVMPRTKFRDAAVILMLIHQFFAFGMIALPMYIAWEKLLGCHDHEKTRYIVKVIARVPVMLCLWLVAVMIPFFGPINSAVGSIVTSFSVYVIPCAAHMAYYLPSGTKDRKMVLALCVDLAIICWVLVTGLGLGSWASIQQIRKEVKHFGLFAKCYQCTH